MHTTIVMRLGLAAGASAAFWLNAAFAQSMPELSVHLRGRTRSVPGFETEQLALVELEFTEAKRSATGTIPVSFSEVDSDLETAPSSEVPLDPLERDDVTAPNSDASGRLRGREGPNKKQAIRKDIPYILTPGYVRQAVAAALGAQGISATFDRLDSLSTRAKTSSMLPEVRLRAGRDVDQSLRLSPTADDPYRYTQSGAVAFVMEGAVTWRLSRLAFAAEELSIERLRLAQSRERQRVTVMTLNELTTWQAAWRRVAALGAGAGQAAEDLAESALRLEILTGGWFSAHQPASDPLDTANLPDPPRAKPASVPAPGDLGAPNLSPDRARPPSRPLQAGKASDSDRARRPETPERLERVALSR